MSGIGKSIGKIFKKVAKVAKVVLPIALIAAAAIITGGMALAAIAPAAGALGAAGAGGVIAGGPLAGAALGSGAALTGGAVAATGASAVAAGTGAAASTGIAGFVGSMFTPATLGKMAVGIAGGLMQGQTRRDDERAVIDAERRRQATYKGVGDVRFDFDQLSDAGQGLSTGGQTQLAAASSPAPKPATKRYHYNPSTGRIGFA